MLAFFKRPPSEPAPASRPATERAAAVSVPRTEDHPEWTKDLRIAGTFPESAQVGTVRQLFRVIGQELGKTTPNAETAIHAAKRAMEGGLTTDDHKQALYAAVDTLSKADEGYDHATRLLTQHFREALGHLPSDQKLQRLMAISTSAFKKMIDTQLSKPDFGTIRTNGDDSMVTQFGMRGEVQHVELRLLRGKLSGYLAHNLQEAERDYQDQKQRLQAGGVIKNDSVFEVRLKAGSKLDHTFKTTATGLKTAYLRALVEYASVAYADRVRGSAAPALEA